MQERATFHSLSELLLTMLAGQQQMLTQMTQPGNQQQQPNANPNPVAAAAQSALEAAKKGSK